MITLKDYIYENRQNYLRQSKSEYENNLQNFDKHKNLAEYYLNELGKDKVRTAIENAVNETNNVLSPIFTKLNDNEDCLKYLMDGRVIGKLIEINLAKLLSNTTKFKFSVGDESKYQKDLYCTDKIDGLDVDLSIELKCTCNSITGNKSYALDNSTDNRKDKDSYYILIFYDKNNNKAPIKLNKVYFGFLTQADWFFSNTGNSANLQMKIIKKHKLIEI